MTGIGMAAAAGATVLPPLSCNIQITSSSGTDNVSGGTNDLYTWSGGTHLVFVGVTGGSGSYPTITIGYVEDSHGGSASSSMALSGDGVHNTIFWSGLAVGNDITYHLTLNVTDSLGNSASAVWPSVGSATIHRTT